ncbi:uncharacterized protein LOC118185238 isoform X2 [Stegodyphus dumicola]|uniref:uncharacterized protein LOC118185238 isoform X2 n=1 Tax=Stegodyphus dumicola TaxID=202533 RepID=UPI0015AF2AFC|nr:uncharacterized protein LOC118185238 isoform X2 [Stegodyphus dumicola]
MDDCLNLEFFYQLERKGKKSVIEWCMEKRLITRSYKCPICKTDMKLVERKNCLDGFEWMCRVTRGECKHRISRSVRKDSWFTKSKLSMCDILRVTYMWLGKCRNDFIRSELGVAKNTVTCWKSFCREVCIELCLKENIMRDEEDAPQATEQLDSYLAEHMWRRQKKESNTCKLMQIFLNNISTVYSVKVKADHCVYEENNSTEKIAESYLEKGAVYITLS